MSSPIHWTVLVSDATVKASKEGTAAHLAAMALAHHRPYGDAITTGASTKESLRAAIDSHYHPMLAAFSAAAFLHDWTPEQVDQAIEDGAAVDEWTWQWLTDAGVPVADLAHIAWSLNAPDVIDSNPARTA